ncbi:MAG: ATPase [Chlorobi bacterium]|nr:ATPase [Chlorobiota bacterium]
MIGISVAYSQTSKTVKFKVYGNCDICKESIEKAAYSVEGVSHAFWNKKTKIISVSLDSTKTNKDRVSMAIAKTGHDTEMHLATIKDYESLPECCQFERRIDQKDIKFK